LGKLIGTLARMKTWIGLSVDTKPTGCQVGAMFREFNKGKTYITPDGGVNWVLERAEGAIFQSTTIDLNQAAGDYDLFTAGLSDLELLHLSCIIPADLTAEATLTSISIQTTDDTPIVLVSSTAGAVANLTENKYLQYDDDGIMEAEKKIQLTIAGGATAASQVCTVFTGYREAT